MAEIYKMHGVKKIIYEFKLQFVITIIFLLIWLAFYMLNPSAFSNSFTYTSIMGVAPFTIIPAISLTLVIITGEIDLSFASVMALGPLVMAMTWQFFGEPTPLGILLGLLAGLGAGLLNGILITKLGIPSLIATIGTLFLWRGVVLVVTQGFSIPLGQFKDSPIYSIFVGRLCGLPVQFFWTIGLAIIFWILLNRHKFGAYIYYIGDNRTAARMVGINVDRVLITVYAIHGMIAAFAGILDSLEMATFWPALGDIYMLKSIASVVIGGTPVTGGVGTIYGTFLGGMILEFIEMGVLSSGVSGFWIRLVHGVVIIIALAAQGIIRKGELAKIRIMRMLTT
ncbi:MAG: ABC transporter permease [Staphylothermus sp.]|nr:ABC transporter permease [Staphylothermus sp.]